MADKSLIIVGVIGIAALALSLNSKKRAEAEAKAVGSTVAAGNAAVYYAAISDKVKETQGWVENTYTGDITYNGALVKEGTAGLTCPICGAVFGDNYILYADHMAAIHS